MRVLHIIPSVADCRGGASTAAINMVRALQHRGVNAEIACTNDNCGSELEVPLGEISEFSGVPVRFFARYTPAFENAITRAIREFQISRPLYRWLSDNIGDYDLLHVHALFSYTSSFAMRLARKRGIPYIAHPIGSLERWSLQQSPWRKRAFLALLDRANLNRASLVHFTAEHERRQAAQVMSNPRHLVLPLGVDMLPGQDLAKSNKAHQFQLDATHPLILFLGRLHPKKGIELFLGALKQLRDQSPYFIIAGTGDSDYVDTLKRRVSDLGLSDRVRFVGHVEGDQKQALLAAADLFVLTSFAENFAIAPVEAMAAGTAVLLTDTVGVVEYLVDKPVGAICQPNEGSILSSLETLIADRKSLTDMGLAARDLVSTTFSWDQIAMRLEQAYGDCVSRQQS